MALKGWIALDIDGTITLDKYSVPGEVTSFLRRLNLDGWGIVLATGRPFAFAAMALSLFDFPFTVLAQNGSIGLDMPSRKILFKRYISAHLIPLVEQAYQGIDTDFLIYAGYEKGDFCYWRPHRMCKEDLQYVDDLQKRQKENWQPVESYESVHLDTFPLIKCFGPKHRMKIVADRLLATGKFQVAMIRDPFVEGFFLLLVTDRLASKGQSLNALFQLKGRGAKVIAAGDDENDISLLQAADIKIAMAHAPESLQQVANFIAPPTHQQGIIHAIQLALKQC
ncbi:MAG TPA: HAD family hydrolase [Chlamydiales bacterium]|nr:HAD family hydrolase [Chlamydiales bacterium]